MTMNEIVAYVADELSLTSAEAKARINRELNVRYKQITSSIGMAATRREVISQAATIGSRYITFTGAERLDTVFRKVGTQNIILNQLTDDEMKDITPGDEPPTAYSVFSLAPQAVTLELDCTPSTAFLLYATVVADVTSISGTQSPAFPESFHDVLIYGVLADEYRRAEKAQYAKDAEQSYLNRLSDLRMFIAKSAYLDIYRGKHQKSEGWWDTGGSE
jgi:hypothetical protein